jgi:hypothetical protein
MCGGPGGRGQGLASAAYEVGRYEDAIDYWLQVAALALRVRAPAQCTALNIFYPLGAVADSHDSSRHIQRQAQGPRTAAMAGKWSPACRKQRKEYSRSKALQAVINGVPSSDKCGDAGDGGARAAGGCGGGGGAGGHGAARVVGGAGAPQPRHGTPPGPRAGRALRRPQGSVSPERLPDLMTRGERVDKHRPVSRVASSTPSTLMARSLMPSSKRRPWSAPSTTRRGRCCVVLDAPIA